MSGFAERRWATPDGLTLYARDYAGEGGEGGLPVLCLHGFTRNSKDFEDLAPVIAASLRRVIAMDMRGRGQSDRDPNPANYHPKIYARDVLGFLAALAIPRAVFLGTSMGGLITLTIALLHPKAIAAAILNDVGPVVDPAGISRIQSYAGRAPAVRNWQDAADHCRAINAIALPIPAPRIGLGWRVRPSAMARTGLSWIMTRRSPILLVARQNPPASSPGSPSGVSRNVFQPC